MAPHHRAFTDAPETRLQALQAHPPSASTTAASPLPPLPPKPLESHPNEPEQVTKAAEAHTQKGKQVSIDSMAATPGANQGGDTNSSEFSTRSAQDRSHQNSLAAQESNSDALNTSEYNAHSTESTQQSNSNHSTSQIISLAPICSQVSAEDNLHHSHTNSSPGSLNSTESETIAAPILSRPASASNNSLRTDSPAAQPLPPRFNRIPSMNSIGNMPTRRALTRSSSFGSRPQQQPISLSNSASGSQAGPSSGRLDPDAHWLSEDEGRGSNQAELGRRLRRRQHRAREIGYRSVLDHNSDEDDSESGNLAQGGDKDTENVNLFANNTRANRHSIHQRPAQVISARNRSTSPRSASPAISERPINQILPELLQLLTCPACQRLYRDPTTLSCGHSVCVACSYSVVHRTIDLPVVHSSEPTTQHSIPMVSSESLFSRNPARPVSIRSNTTSSGMVRSSSFTTSESAASTYRGKGKCPHRDCNFSKDRSLAFKGDAHVDFVLKKVLGLVRLALPEIDSKFDKTRSEVEQSSKEDEFDLGVNYPPEEISRSNSGSSAGGGEDPEIDELKRIHRQRTNWESSKRRKTPNVTEISPDLTEVTVRRLDLDYEVVPTSFAADVLSELECQICVQLLHQPVTSSCGHTFCQKCLARSYDHSDKCPLCRADFPSFAQFQAQPINSTTQKIIQQIFPSLASERSETISNEEKGDNKLDTPLFVCTLAWPNLPTYIHIFEPRYRLMIRRAMEANRQFGMVLPSRDQGGISEYGTMLYIQSCNMIEDGRSIVETVGTHRFRVIERGTLDGYTVGRIEKVVDVSEQVELELERRALETNSLRTSHVTGADGTPPQIERSTTELMNICLEFVQTLRTGSAPWVLQRLNNTIGPMPSAPADFSFWMAEVMPVDDHIKALLLQITSPRERLRLIVFWIEQFRSSWWFSRGCSIM